MSAKEKRLEILARARQCLGTPFRPQARRPGDGIDCIGLIVHAAGELLSPEADWICYRLVPTEQNQTDLVLRLREAGFCMVDKPLPGRVLVLWKKNKILHVGITNGEGGMVHAWTTATEKGCVVEARNLRPAWAVAVHSYWEFPGVE